MDRRLIVWRRTTAPHDSVVSAKGSGQLQLGRVSREASHDDLTGAGLPGRDHGAQTTLGGRLDNDRIADARAGNLGTPGNAGAEGVERNWWLAGDWPAPAGSTHRSA